MTDLLGLTDHGAVVVGGGFGMGRATAEMLADAGARVAVVDLEPARADEVADAIGGGAVAITADVTDPDQARRAIGEALAGLGRLDHVVDIVGRASWTSLDDLDADTWQADLDLNLTQHLHVARAAIDHLPDGGTIAVVASVSGLYSAPNHGAYGVAKAGLMALVRTMADEWFGRGIRVNAVAPGAVRTPRIEQMWASGDVTMPTGDALRRLALPTDIAGALVFLSSALSQRITGQTLVVDGGTTSLFPWLHD